MAVRINPNAVAKLGGAARKLVRAATPTVRATKPKMRVPPERDVQRSILAMIEAEFDAVANHVPTQAMVRGKINNIHAFMAVRRKDGVVDGWPDLQVRWRHGRMCFLEIKRPGEDAEQHQRDVHAALKADGFLVAVVHNDEEARRALIAAGVPTRGFRMPTGAVLLNRGGAQ